jgi:hypothetical protein
MTYSDIMNAANGGRDFNSTNHGVKGKRVWVCSPLTDFAHLTIHDEMSFNVPWMVVLKNDAYIQKGRQIAENGEHISYVVSYMDIALMIVLENGKVIFNEEKNLFDAKGNRILDKLIDGYWGHPKHYGDTPVKEKISWTEFEKVS